MEKWAIGSSQDESVVMNLILLLGILFQGFLGANARLRISGPNFFRQLIRCALTDNEWPKRSARALFVSHLFLVEGGRE